MGNIYKDTKYTRVHDLGWMIDLGLGTSRSLVIAFRKGTTQGAVRTVDRQDRQLCHKATSGRLVLPAPSYCPWKGVIIR